MSHDNAGTAAAKQDKVIQRLASQVANFNLDVTVLTVELESKTAELEQAKARIAELEGTNE